MKRRIWIIIGIVLVLAVAVVVIGANNDRIDAVAQSASSDGQIGQVVRTTLSSAVESSGSIAAQDDVALSFRTGGTVAQVNVDVGHRVKTGDVLAKLDTAQLELQVARAEQSYLLQQATYSKTVQPDPDMVAAAQAALNNAHTTYQIALHKNSLSGDQITVSCADLDNAKRAYDDAATAYNNTLSDWRVQVYGTYEVSPQKARLDNAKAAYDLGCPMLYSLNRERSGYNTELSSVSEIIGKYYWLHEVKVMPVGYQKMLDDGPSERDYRHLVGWRRVQAA